MVARVRCPVGFCQAWIPLNGEEEARLASLRDDHHHAEILCIACGVHSNFYRQDLISAQLETFYASRVGIPRASPGLGRPGTA
jgi:hypothetical protein